MYWSNKIFPSVVFINSWKSWSLGIWWDELAQSCFLPIIAGQKYWLIVSEIQNLTLYLNHRCSLPWSMPCGYLISFTFCLFHSYCNQDQGLNSQLSCSLLGYLIWHLNPLCHVSRWTILNGFLGHKLNVSVVYLVCFNLVFLFLWLSVLSSFELLVLKL